MNAAPLFEEEGYSGLDALISNVNDPGMINRPRARTGFPANDCPVDPAQIHLVQWTEERLQREEFHMRAGSAQMIDTVEILRIFDANAHPDVRCPFEVRA